MFAVLGPDWKTDALPSQVTQMSGSVPARPRPTLKVLLLVSGGLLITLLAVQFIIVVLDLWTTIPYQGQLDYGEGIVWQQAVLMFGPRMYSPSPALPFIVFHYPPLYYAAVRVLMSLSFQPLESGRLVSAISSLASGGVVAALVLTCYPQPRSPLIVLIAVAAGTLTLMPIGVRTWAGLMRVDMLAIAIGLAATLVAVRSKGSFLMLTVALLLAVASMFAKQTQLPAGLAISAVGLICWPRTTLKAGIVAALVGFAGVALLQAVTHGFLQNIVGNNLNLYSFQHGLDIIWAERTSFPYLLIMSAGALALLYALCQRSEFLRLRQGDVVAVTRALNLVHFALATLASVAVFKIGSGPNYLFDMQMSGSVLIGVLMGDLLRRPLIFTALAVILAATTANLPLRHYHRAQLEAWLRLEQPVVDAIRAAKKPVVADNLVLVMRAGKSLVYEPAIVEQLIATGAWDPSALLKMIADQGFAFAVVQDEVPKGGPIIADALMAAFPHTETVIPSLRLLFVGQMPPIARATRAPDDR